MSLATALNSHRRQLALGALIVLLHVLVFEWFNGQLGRRTDPKRDQAAQVAAQLVEAPAPAPLPPVPPPRPALAPPPPLPEVAQEPLPPSPPSPLPAAAPDAQAPMVAEESNAVAAPDAGEPQTGQAGAVAAGPDVQLRQDATAQQASAAPAQAPAAPAAAAQSQAPPEVKRYKVDLPPSADITLDVARVDADGTRWNGEALLSWTVTPPGYRIRVEAGIRVVFTRVNLLTLTSEGTVGDEGFVPTLMTEKRRGRSLTATHFNRKDGTLTFSASQAKYALVPGAQDKASVPLQLAGIARADSRQLSGNIDILVGEDRDASVFSFVVAGQEQLDTRLGRIATWHLVRPPKPGSYNSRLELWLAPGYGWYPVQIRNTEASGAVTTQTVSNIVIKNAGS